jgi:hypothetical protein
MYEVTWILFGSLFKLTTPSAADAYIAASLLPNARLWDRRTKGRPVLI